MKKNISIIIAFLVLLSTQVFAQKAQITGVVKDKEGAFLEGATVSEKEFPANKTTTDNNGRFVLFPKGRSGIVIINYIGYQPEEMGLAANASGNIITLESIAKSLDDVVVVGYSTQKKITVTGAVSAVSGKELRQSPSASLQNTLAGRLTGFSSQQQSGRPGGDGARFFVRGQSTFVGADGAGNNPLILVDDIEFTYDQFQRMDANEVASVSILKDASTTAIYGIKGANGVILVTTSRGKIGAPKVSVRSSYGLSQYTKIPDYLNAANAATLWRQTELNSGVAPGSTVLKDSDIAIYRNGTSPYTHPNNNWKDILFKQFAPELRTNFDLTGGTEKAKYFMSVGYLNQGGQVKNYSDDLNSEYYYKRYNYRSNLDLNVNKDLNLRFDLYGNINETNEPVISGLTSFDVYAEYGRFRNTFPGNYPINNPNGSLGYSFLQQNYLIDNSNNLVGRLMYNGYRRTFANNMNVVLSGIQKLAFIAQGLSFKATLSYGSATTNGKSLTRGNQFPTYIYTPGTDSYLLALGTSNFRKTIPLVNAVAGTGLGTTNRALTIQAILSYDRDFGRHHFYGLGLYNQNSKWAPNGANTDYNFVPENTLGFTGRVGYDFNEKYLFELNMGYNGSDRFTKEKRYGFFPAVSAGWNLSKENFFMKNLKFMNQFKIKGSYGLVGNDNTGGVYGYLQSYASGSGSGLFGGGSSTNSFNIITEGTLPNPNVTWEKEKKLDLGLDFSLLDRKLSGSLGYFKNERYDIITFRGAVSDIIGQTLPNVNLGKTSNTGYELELSFRDNITKNLSYSIRANYSVAKNKVLFRDDPQALFPWQDRTNKPIGSLLKYRWTGEFYSQQDLDQIAGGKLAKPSVGARLGDLKYQDLNGDLIIDDYDKAYFGNTNFPTTTYGFQLGVNYKGFALSILFQGVREVASGVLQTAIEFNGPSGANAQPIHQQSWTPELGNDAKFPRLYNSYNINSTATAYSDFWAIPADYLRLKTAEISYAFGPGFIRRLGVGEVRVFANGFNLLTWTKFNKLYDFDPEIRESQTTLGYPPSRTLNFGLNITF